MKLARAYSAPGKYAGRHAGNSTESVPAGRAAGDPSSRGRPSRHGIRANLPPGCPSARCVSASAAWVSGYVRATGTTRSPLPASAMRSARTESRYRLLSGSLPPTARNPSRWARPGCGDRDDPVDAGPARATRRPPRPSRRSRRRRRSTRASAVTRSASPSPYGDRLAAEPAHLVEPTRARGADRADTPRAEQLEEHDADRAGRAMDEHRLPRRGRDDAQHVARGRADEQQVGRGREVERWRFGEHVLRRDRDRRAVGAGDAERDHLVARPRRRPRRSRCPRPSAVITPATS